MSNYSDGFYVKRHQKTLHSAEAIISLLLKKISPITSAVDVGCGVGTWLSVLKSKGAVDILGIDGNWVNKDYLAIPQECFMEWDLTRKVEVDRKFELAISLEVAEHLPSTQAATFVESLISLSDIILFSAAIPYQGGLNHINEQWPSYWAQLFNERGYRCEDILRMHVWNDSKIPLHYKQNTLLFVRNGGRFDSRLESSTELSWAMPPSMVHPDLYLAKTKPLTVQQSFKVLLRTSKRAIKQKLSPR